MPNLLPPADRRSVVLLMAYVAVSLFLLVVGERIPTQWLRGAGAVIFEPFDRVVMTGANAVKAWTENATLHARIVRLETENARLRGAGAENQALRAQLGFESWKGLALTPVEVLALSGEAPPATATLSAGHRHRIEEGDAVLTSDGLIGRVTESWGSRARASLLTDPNLAVACEVETTGVHGVLRFSPGPLPRLLMTAVSLSDTVRVGERIVTSDLSVRFPRGIPIGVVVRIAADPTGLLQEIEVRAAARFTRLRHAFIAPGPLGPGELASPVPRTLVERKATP